MPCCKCIEFRWEDPQDPIYTDEDGKEYCLFHAPAEHKGMSGNQFNKQVFARINAVKRKIELGDETAICNLSCTVFPKSISFWAYNKSNPLPNITFQNASFNGNAMFNKTFFNGNAWFQKTFFGRVAIFSKSFFSKYSRFNDATFSEDANFFETSFAERSEFYNVTFVGNTQFSKTFFGGNVGFNQATFSGMALFHDASFSGNAIFFKATFANDARFNNISFKRDAKFNESFFGTNASFTETSFDGKAWFYKSSFINDARFNFSVFSNDAWFYKTSFGKDANFLGVQFVGKAIFNMSIMCTAHFEQSKFNSDLYLKGFRSGKAYFTGTSFNQNADFTASIIFDGSDFKDAHFQGGAYFNNALLGGKTYFERTRFKDYLSFDRTRFYGKSFFKQTYFKEAVHFGRAFFLRRAAFEACSAKEQITMDRVDMSNVRLFNSPLESISFISCEWPKDEKDRNVVADSDIYNKKPGLLEDIYRRLKRKAKEDNDELMASSWHFMEKEMTRERLKAKDDKSLKEWFLCLALCIYRTISGYGEEPLKALITLVIFLFGLFLICWFFQLYEFNFYLKLYPINWDAVNKLSSDILRGLPLAKIPSGEQALGLKSIFYWFWQIIITIQFAIFAFALRNKLRR